MVSFSFPVDYISNHLEFLHFAESPVKLGEARKHTCAGVRRNTAAADIAGHSQENKEY